MIDKKDCIKLIDELFIPIGFKRKGNNWVYNDNELSKIVNLQKSNYGNFSYINYGYIIRGLELTTRTHVENRLASTNQEQQNRITDLLDLETNISPAERLVELKNLMLDKIFAEFQVINGEGDLLNSLRHRNHLNDIPLVVKKHFKIS